MNEEIKVFSFNFKDFKPDEKGLYTYQNKQYTYRQFYHFLKINLIWFYVNKETIEVLK